MNLIDWGETRKSEIPALELLQQLGYEYKEGKELSPQGNKDERSSLREVILKNRLINKIKEFNPWINDTNIKHIIRMLTIFEYDNLIEINIQFWEYLTKKSHLGVEQDRGGGLGRRFHRVKLIDWKNVDNNEFLVTNQFKVNGPKKNYIPDIIIFINGLPLVVIECKSPLLTNPMEHAISQLHDYQEWNPKLFYYNQFNITINRERARYGVIGNSFENYKIWREPYPISLDKLEQIIARTGRATPRPSRQDILLYGLLEKHNLLNLIRNFIIYEGEYGRIVKKIARYQQFRATNKTIKQIITEKDNSLRGGTIWHTQGSGKSLTMLYTAIKLRREKSLNNPLLVFVCDRIDLVKQLNGTFNRCSFSNPIDARNADDLKALIKLGQGNTVFTTIQKFRADDADDEGVSKSGKEYPELNDDPNIFVLVDEAHRSQYKIFATNMRLAMPNACFIAYTGTPLARNEKKQVISVGRGKTVNKFGKIIDMYDIRQSVEDGSTIEIFYENFLPEQRVEGETIDDIFDRVFSKKSSEEREQLKKKYVTLDAILAAPDRISKISLDIINHFERKIEPDGFKGQIVVSSRKLAVMYKKNLDELNAPESVVIISGNPKHDDDLKELNTEFITDKLQQQEKINRFKDKDDPLKFLIVCDMLITGFDAPIEQVMYLDKSLKEHNLLQAIARVNRTYEGKKYGLIVDYYGVSYHLKRALEIFDAPDIEGFMRSIESELFPLEQYHKTILSYFPDIDLHTTDYEPYLIILDDEKTRMDFFSDFKKFSTSMDIVLPDPRGSPYIYDLKKFGALIKVARNRLIDEQLNLAGCGKKIQKLIDDHIFTSKMKALIEPVPILSERFQQALEELKEDVSKASQMEHAIKHETTVKLEEDPVFYTSLKEKLKKIIEDYTQNRIDLAEKIERLQEIVHEIRARPSIARQMGLNPSELALYNTLNENLEDLYEADEKQFVQLTYEILESVDPQTSMIDWQNKPDLLRQIRSNTKTILLEKNIENKNKIYDKIAKNIEELLKVHFSSR